MSLYILNPLPISFSVHVQDLAREPKPFLICEDDEVFEHLRCLSGRKLADWHEQAYFWDLYETLRKKERKMFFRLLRCIEKNQPKGAACAARHVFRIARARERKESAAMRGEL